MRLNSHVFSLLFLFSFICNIYAGWIEDAQDRTILHVSVSQLPDPTRIDPASRAALAALKAFKEDFPSIFAERYKQHYQGYPEVYGKHNWNHVEIVLEPFTGIQVKGVESDLLAIAGGMAPDILYVNFRKSDNYIQNGFLYPLDNYFGSLTPEDITDRINAKLWPVIRRKGPEGNIHTWTLPYDGALGKVLLYRKDLFDAYHIPHPTPQWTWDDLLDAAKKLTHPAKGEYGMFLWRGKHESAYWLTFLWSAGGDVMQYDKDTGQWNCIFDSHEATLALDFYTRLSAEKWIDKQGIVRRGYSAKDASDISTKWNRGQIGMMFAYIDEKFMATINPDTTGMVPVPLGPTGQRGAELNSKMMGLFAEIKEPAIRDAAWEYMRYYDSTKAMKIKTKIFVDSGLGAFVNPRYLKKFGYEEILHLIPKHLAETFDVAIETGHPEPYGKNSNFAYELMTVPIAQAEQLALSDQLPTNPTKRLELLNQLLKDANTRANEVMLGQLSPKEQQTRHWSAAGVLLLMVASMTYAARRIARAFTPPRTVKKSLHIQHHLQRYLWAYLLLLPAVITILVWKYIPLIRGANMAFYDYRLIGRSLYVGLDNFGNILFDSFWWKALFNAFHYSFLVILLTFIPPIVLAILLHEIPKGKRVFRLVYYLPAVISGLVTMILWKQFYEPSENGMLNAILLKTPLIVFIIIGLLCFSLCILFARRLFINGSKTMAVLSGCCGCLLFYAITKPIHHFLWPFGSHAAPFFSPGYFLPHLTEPVRWLSSPDTAMASCVIPMIWAGMGPGCLIYLAALKHIPEEYYEAADMDGAGFIDKILFVVIPQLRFLIIINFVGVFIGSWYTATGNILVMTAGAANTEVAGLHIWYKAFTYLQFGPATAMAWMLGFILIGFTVQQLTLLSNMEFKSSGSS